MAHEVVFQELKCADCGGGHSNVLARCLTSGIEVRSWYARGRGRRRFNSEGDGWLCAFGQAVRRLDEDCDGKHFATGAPRTPDGGDNEGGTRA